MKNKPDSLLLSVILTMMPITGLSNEYITQQPTHLELTEGNSGTFQCSVKRDIDLRGLSLKKARSKFLQFCVSSSNYSDILSFSGTIENLNCKINAKDKSTCTVGSDVSKATQDELCSPPPENSLQKFLYSGSQAFASIWVKSGYTSRISFDGTIRDLKLTLQDFTKDDSGSYSCSGSATSIGEFNANSTQLTVTEESSKTAIIVVCVLIPICLIIIVGFLWWRRKKRRTQNRRSDNL